MKGLETIYRIRQWGQLQDERSRCQSKTAADSVLDAFRHSKISMYLKCHQEALRAQTGAAIRNVDIKYSQTSSSLKVTRKRREALP